MVPPSPTDGPSVAHPHSPTVQEGRRWLLPGPSCTAGGASAVSDEVCDGRRWESSEQPARGMTAATSMDRGSVRDEPGPTCLMARKRPDACPDHGTRDNVARVVHTPVCTRE